MNLKQLREVLKEGQRIAKELEAVLREAQTPVVQSGHQEGQKEEAAPEGRGQREWPAGRDERGPRGDRTQGPLH